MENDTNIDPTHDKSQSPEEPFLPWQPGGALGSSKLDLKNGEQYLMVVRLAGRLGGGEPWMDWHVVEVLHGPNGVVFHSNGWTWTWSDVTYYLPLAKLKLPHNIEKPH
jgi:hypothetical protein